MRLLEEGLDDFVDNVGRRWTKQSELVPPYPRRVVLFKANMSHREHDPAG